MSDKENVSSTFKIEFKRAQRDIEKVDVRFEILTKVMRAFKI